MAIVARTSTAQVYEYRAYVMGHDGHISSFRAFVCYNDADVWAKQLVEGHEIEFWSDERFVIR